MNNNVNDAPASTQSNSKPFYERLTNNPAHAMLFAVGVGLVTLAAVEAITGQQTQPIARWRWLFQLARDWMGAYGPTILVFLIGTLMICWAVIGAEKQLHRSK